MNPYQILSIVGSMAAFVISGYLYQQYTESKFHRIYATGYVAVGLFAFSLFGLSTSDTAGEAWIWLRFSAIVHAIPPITLHAIVQVAKASQKRLPVMMLALLYLPFSLLFIEDSLFTELSYQGIVAGPFGWEIQLRTNSVVHVIDMALYFACIALQAIILSRILLFSKNQSKRRFAWFVSITYLVPIFICSILIFIVPYFATSVLRLEPVFVFIVCVTTVICLYRWNIFDLSVNIISKDIISGMSNFLILLNQDRKIIDVNDRTVAFTFRSRSELLLSPISMLIESDELKKIFSHNLGQINAELDIRQANGSRFPAIISVAKIIKKNEFLGYVIIGSDLSNVRNIMEEKKIVELELKALVRQMNPHFLFNSLNGLQHFILKQDEVKANEYITKFATLMRNILHSTESDDISLSKEVENIRLYLELEHLRFHGRFNYSIHVDEAIDEQFVKLPTMMIQPFLENAIWHGLLPKERDALLTIQFTWDIAYICCVIEDNGIGRDLSEKLNHSKRPHHRSTAIKNIVERIDILNRINRDDRAMKINIIDLFDGDALSVGTRVELRFPC